MYSVYFAFCLGSVLYALASVQIFAFLRSPLTYALLYLADDMGTMSSSIGQFLSLLLRRSPSWSAPVLWVLAVRYCDRRFPLPRTPFARGTQALALGALLCFVQIADDTERGPWRDRDDRRIAQNPHWVLVSSYAAEMLTADHTGGFELAFPPEYLQEFERRQALAPRQSRGPGRRPTAAQRDPLRAGVDGHQVPEPLRQPLQDDAAARGRGQELASSSRTSTATWA